MTVDAHRVFKPVTQGSRFAHQDPCLSSGVAVKVAVRLRQTMMLDPESLARVAWLGVISHRLPVSSRWRGQMGPRRKAKAEVFLAEGFRSVTWTSAQTKELATSMAEYCHTRPLVPVSRPMWKQSS
jgi:hypothetical protein